jgi:hypothetical protein
MGKFMNIAATTRTLLFHYTSITVLFHTHMLCLIWKEEEEKVEEKVEEKEEEQQQQQKVTFFMYSAVTARRY